MTRRLAAALTAALTAAGILAAAAGCASPGVARQAPAGQASAGQASAGRASAGQASAQAPARVSAARQRTAGSCNPDASSLAPSGGASASPGSFAAAIRQRGYLVAGVDQSTYHFGFLNPIDNKLEGFDIDMVDAVAQAIFGPGYQSHLHFKAIHNADRIPDLVHGTVDIVADTMTVNCDRLKQIDFSAVYYAAHAELLVLNNSPAKSLADLKGQKVCAVGGSDDIALIQRAGAVPVEPEPTYWTDCLVDLQQGTAAGIVTDDSILHGLQAQDPFTKLLTQQLEPEPYGLGISRAHPDFVRFVNAVLTQVESSGQWSADYRQWVGGPAQSPPPLRYAP